MNRRAFLTAAVALAAAPIAAQEPRVARIGWLTSGVDGGNIARFSAALRQHGLHDGIHYRIEPRFAEGRLEALRGLAEELTRLPVDAIIAVPTSAALAAKQATSSIPILVLFNLDAVKSGVVDNLVRPGANVTGLTLMSSELIGKRLEILREIVPRARRLGVLSIADIPHITAHFLQEMGAVASSVGIELEIAEVAEPYDFEGAFRRMADADAIYVLESQALGVHRARIMALALERRLPVISGAKPYVQAGGLASYAPDGQEIIERAAAQLVKILAGARPGDLPMEQPTKFELAVNLRTARALGIELPASLLARADEVIE